MKASRSTVGLIAAVGAILAAIPPPLSAQWPPHQPAGAVVHQRPPVTTFRDVAANVKEGLPLQPWAADLVNTRRAGNSKDNPDAH